MEAATLQANGNAFDVAVRMRPVRSAVRAHESANIKFDSSEHLQSVRNCRPGVARLDWVFIEHGIKVAIKVDLQCGGCRIARSDARRGVEILSGFFQPTERAQRGPSI